MTEFKHGFVHANGIRMHYVEQGEGPLVVLCHGWPESWYSWRRQLPALAEAGFRAVAPDQRGYGLTEAPDVIAAYHIFNLVGDIVGLVNALGATEAIVVGHDWGSIVAQQCALLRPDLFRALALMSVPFLARKPVRPAAAYHLATQQMNFYQEYFQESGRVERELEEDVRASLLGIYFGASGDAPPQQAGFGMFPKNVRFADAIRSRLPDKLPSWLTEADLDFFAAEFTRAGFRGGINWYRNIDRLWELTPFQNGAKIIQPSLFVAGERDGVLRMAAEDVKTLDTNIPRLKGKHIVPGAGHWVQQERPVEVNQLLTAFVKSL
jgi:pimeloyl-ACP methyl ester carboxylesterase